MDLRLWKVDSQREVVFYLKVEKSNQQSCLHESYHFDFELLSLTQRHRLKNLIQNTFHHVCLALTNPWLLVLIITAFYRYIIMSCIELEFCLLILVLILVS